MSGKESLFDISTFKIGIPPGSTKSHDLAYSKNTAMNKS